jgi:hypothetical protein
MGRLFRAALPGLFVALALALGPASRAEAQYRSYTFGFEAGYQALTTGIELKQNNLSFGLHGGYKLADNWWFSGRAQLSFPGELRASASNTVVLLHLVPISVQYYFLTDSFRPYVSLTNAFEILINANTSQAFFWGPGAGAGVEFKLARDIFLGVKVDGFMMLRFDLPAAVVMANAQLIFFL